MAKVGVLTWPVMWSWTWRCRVSSRNGLAAVGDVFVRHDLPAPRKYLFGEGLAGVCQAQLNSVICRLWGRLQRELRVKFTAKPLSCQLLCCGSSRGVSPCWTDLVESARCLMVRVNWTSSLVWLEPTKQAFRYRPNMGTPVLADLSFLTRKLLHKVNSCHATTTADYSAAIGSSCQQVCK